MHLVRRLIVGAGWFLSYVAAAVLFHWPLPARLTSALPGEIGGDTGVYVWNLWVFRHEIVEHRRFPLFTEEILALTPPIDLSLHNYTLFADALAFPLIPLLGVTATFNVLLLAITALSAWSMFLLARRVTGATAESWLAGLLFGFSPILMARSTAHFSLVAAAPLPIFVLCLLRLERSPSAANAIAAGATVAWAATCDPYFGVYCLMIGACYAAARIVRVARGGSLPAAGVLAGRAMTLAIWATAGVLAAVAAAVGLFGVTEISVLGRRVGLSLHSPALALTILVMARAIARYRPAFEVRWPVPPARAVRAALVAGAACGLLLSPLLAVLARRLADGGDLHGPIYWRSGPKGMDLLAFFTPNPGNALVGGPARDWLTGQNNGYAENVAALGLVATVLVAIAIWKFSFRPPRLWTAFAIFFGALALGPFVSVGGINTYLLGPWAVLRYLPIVSAARMPGRFAIVLTMAFAVIFALALRHVAERRPERRGMLLAVVGLLLAFELAPLPRQLYAAPVPEIFAIIARDPRDVRVMGIPLGIVDGERGEGRHDGSAQFYQTVHQKPIVGGGLSRISNRERERQRRFPVIRVLLKLSEGREVRPHELARARRAAPGFIRRSRLGYVVIDTRAASPELRAHAIDILRLEKIAESDGRELYRPAGTELPAHLQ